MPVKAGGFLVSCSASPYNEDSENGRGSVT